MLKVFPNQNVKVFDRTQAQLITLTPEQFNDAFNARYPQIITREEVVSYRENLIEAREQLWAKVQRLGEIIINNDDVPEGEVQEAERVGNEYTTALQSYQNVNNEIELLFHAGIALGYNNVNGELVLKSE